METNKNALAIGLVALIIGFGGGYLFCGGHQTPFRGAHTKWGEKSRSGGMMMDGDDMHGAMRGTIDRHFIEQMIPHHEGAITMAKIALTRSKRPEMLSLANAIIDAQTKEIGDMTGWYQSWYGTAVPASSGMGMGGMHMEGMTGDPDALQSVSDVDFDREFINEMIPHHEMAIMMAQMLARGTERPEMKELSKNITTSQSNEIEMMRGWLQIWYGNQQ